MERGEASESVDNCADNCVDNCVPHHPIDVLRDKSVNGLCAM